MQVETALQGVQIAVKVSVEVSTLHNALKKECARSMEQVQETHVQEFARTIEQVHESWRVRLASAEQMAENTGDVAREGLAQGEIDSKTPYSETRDRRDVHIATHCSTLQHTATRASETPYRETQEKRDVHIATHCNTLQHTATRASETPYRETQKKRDVHIATHCNTLQHTATHASETRDIETRERRDIHVATH